MRYKGTFSSINSKKYKITIDTKGDITAESEITLSSSPVVIEWENSDDIIFKPYKCSGCTIRILSEDYMFDIYSSKAHENKVTVTDEENKIIWVGYTSPNLYNQGFSSLREVIEVECVDGLSTLQYFDYSPIHTTKGIVSFKELIDYLVSKCGCYSGYYFSSATKTSSDSSDNILSNLFISEQNFFNEDNEPLKMNEVLEQITQFLGVTALAFGDSVYFMDYSAIKGGNNSYFNHSGTVVNLSAEHNISGDDYAGSNNTISLDNVYNKVTVVDSLYSYDALIPSPFKETDLIDWTAPTLGIWSYSTPMGTWDKAKQQTVFMKWYKNPNYSQYFWSNASAIPSLPNSVNPPQYISTDILNNFTGGYITKYMGQETQKNIISNITLSDYIVLYLNNGYGYINNTDYPLIELNPECVLPTFSLVSGNSSGSFNEDVMGNSGDSYMILSGSVHFVTFRQSEATKEDYKNIYWKVDSLPEKMTKNMKEPEEEFYINLKVQWGNLWWNGNSWVSYDTTFKLPVDNGGSWEDTLFFGEHQIKNTVGFTDGIDEVGYKIPIPAGAYDKKPKISFYTRRSPSSDNLIKSIWIGDFNIKFASKGKLRDDKNDSDTKYSNVIDDEFVSELDEIEFKVCTWDNKEPNYSCVGFQQGDKMEYLDKVFNSGTGRNLRSEEQLIHKIVTQYSTPSTILELTLHNIYKPYTLFSTKWVGDKKMIVDGQSIDLEQNTNNLRLVEIK